MTDRPKKKEHERSKQKNLNVLNEKQNLFDPYEANIIAIITYKYSHAKGEQKALSR